MIPSELPSSPIIAATVAATVAATDGSTTVLVPLTVALGENPPRGEKPPSAGAGARTGMTARTILGTVRTTSCRVTGTGHIIDKGPARGPSPGPLRDPIAQEEEDDESFTL